MDTLLAVAVVLGTALFGQGSLLLYRVGRLEKKLDRLTDAYAQHTHSAHGSPPVAKPWRKPQGEDY